MAEDYTVKQGDFVAKIAAVTGFGSPVAIWNDAANAELKRERKSPNILFPGDRLTIPDKEQKQESGPTDTRHRFEVAGSKLKLRLVLADEFHKPLANAECELALDGGAKQLLVADGKGKIETEIPALAAKASLTVKDPEGIAAERTLTLLIGHLDPVSEPSGQKARLNNLGYFAGAMDEDDDARFRSAVEEFQCEQMGKAAVDGVCGPKTQAKLEEVHGC